MNADAQAILESWSNPIGVDLALCLTIAIYTRGWFQLRSAFPNLIPQWRLAAFLNGSIFVWIAIGSPLTAFDDASLTVHMLQHLLLMSVAPPLILLGAPQLPLLHGLPHSVARKIVGPVLRSVPVKRLGLIVTNPAFCWLAASLVLVGWHVPAVFELALRWEWLHELEHASFVIAGLLFWWPVIQPWPSVVRWPRWSVPLYLFAATLPCDALSAFLAFCDRVVYSPYLSAPRIFAWSPLEDQQCAATLMWVSVTLILLVPAVVVTLEILAPHDARAAEERYSPLDEISSPVIRTSTREAV